MASSIGKTGKKLAPVVTDGNDKILIDSTYTTSSNVYGLGGADDFVFTSTSPKVHLADFQSMDEGNDQLDLSALFSSATTKKISGSNIDHYVSVDSDGYLYVDTSGHGSFSSSPIAQLSDVEAEKIHIRIGTFNGYIQAEDETAPEITAGQSFDYVENKTADAIVATIEASDRAGVTAFRFADTENQLSSDGYFHIDNAGNITITAAGIAVNVAQNDFEKTPNTFTYDIEAGDKAGNWSNSTEITLNVTNDTADDGGGGGGGSPNYIFVTSDSSAYYDLDGDNKLDKAEFSLSNLINLDGTFDFSADTYTIHFVGIGRNSINLSGFEADDSLKVDFSEGWVGDLNRTEIRSAQLYKSSADWAGVTKIAFSKPFDYIYTSATTVTYGYITRVHVADNRGFRVGWNSSSLNASVKLWGTKTWSGHRRGYSVGSSYNAIATWSSGTTSPISNLQVIWPDSAVWSYA